MLGEEVKKRRGYVMVSRRGGRYSIFMSSHE